jgi:hypothetical protein
MPPDTSNPATPLFFYRSLSVSHDYNQYATVHLKLFGVTLAAYIFTLLFGLLDILTAIVIPIFTLVFFAFYCTVDGNPDKFGIAYYTRIPQAAYLLTIGFFFLLSLAGHPLIASLLAFPAFLLVCASLAALYQNAAEEQKSHDATLQRLYEEELQKVLPNARKES